MDAGPCAYTLFPTTLGAMLLWATATCHYALPLATSFSLSQELTSRRAVSRSAFGSTRLKGYSGKKKKKKKNIVRLNHRSVVGTQCAGCGSTGCGSTAHRKLQVLVFASFYLGAILSTPFRAPTNFCVLRRMAFFQMHNFSASFSLRGLRFASLRFFMRSASAKAPWA